MFVNPYINLNMIRNFFLFFLFLISFCFCVNAQYTEVINSNQPGFSESPYSVGQKVYQFESNIFHRNAAAIPTFSNPRATGLNLHFRTGLFDESLEFNLTTSLQNNTFAFENIFESSYTRFTLSEFTIGAKYLIFAPDYKEKAKEIRSWRKRHSFGWDRWIPHISLYGAANFDFILDDYHSRGTITPKFGVLLQNELSNQLNIVTNIYYNYIGGRLPEWSYIVTGTYNFSFKWSGFIEHEALFNKQEKQSNLGIGAAYLLSNDLQINTAVKATFQAENTIGGYVGLGASYRIDRHVDEFIELDEYGNRVDPLTKESYNKGFFGRLFDKIKGIFKKKDKTEVPIDEELAKPQTEDGKEVGRGRTRQKSILGDITKDDEKSKKEKTKEDKKATKKELKANEKEKRDIEKEKDKAARELLKAEEKEKKALEKEELKAAKEEAKLEKEIKKLEDDLAKEEAKKRQEELDKQYAEELAKKEKEKEEKKKAEEEEKKEDEDENNDD